MNRTLRHTCSLVVVRDMIRADKVSVPDLIAMVDHTIGGIREAKDRG